MFIGHISPQTRCQYSVRVSDIVRKYQFLVQIEFLNPWPPKKLLISIFII